MLALVVIHVGDYLQQRGICCRWAENVAERPAGKLHPVKVSCKLDKHKHKDKHKDKQWEWAQNWAACEWEWADFQTGRLRPAGQVAINMTKSSIFCKLVDMPWYVFEATPCGNSIKVSNCLKQEHLSCGSEFVLDGSEFVLDGSEWQVKREGVR